MNKKILILSLLLLVAAMLSAQTSVSNILDLWNVRNNPSGTFEQAALIDMEVTDPTKIVAWDTGATYAIGNIREYTDGFAYYCIQAVTNTDGTQDPGNVAYWTKMWEAAKGWEPIGRTSATAFTGVYDGKGYQIQNLYINRKAGAVANDVYPTSGEDNVGLFGYVENRSGADTYIRGVVMVNPRVSGRRATGTIVGRVLLPITTPARSFTVYIERNSVVGDASSYVEGFGPTGGMVGSNNSVERQRVPVIRYCSANITVRATHPNNYTPNPNDPVGNTGINNPYNIKYGGLVGCNEQGITQDSYARGNVTGGDRVGGIAGCTINGTIYRSYATGTVTRGINPGVNGDPLNLTLPNYEGGWGGIVGRIAGSLPPGLGGGGGSGSVTESFWLEGQSGTDFYTGTNSLTDTQFKDQSSVATNFPTWDYVNIWGYTSGVNGDYPILITSPTNLLHYRSFATSAWGTASNWRTDAAINGTFATTPTDPPNAYNSLSITIMSGHTMTVGSNRTIDQTVVNSGGKIMVSTGFTLTVVDGEATDLLVNGEVEHDGGLYLGTSTLTIVNGTLLTNSASSLTLEGDLIVTGTHTIASGATVTYATNSSKTFSGAAAQNAGAAFPTSVWDLVINNASGVTFPNNFTVNSVLYQLSGNYTITGGNLPNVNGYFSPAVNFFEMKKLTVPNTGFSVAMNNTQADPNFITRQWDITGHIVDTDAFYRTKELTFYWNSADDGNRDWGSIFPYVYAGINPIVPHVRSMDTNPRWVKIYYEFPATASKATQNFKIGLGDDQTLPVELSSFTAAMHMGNTVQLMWITQSETNLSGYRIYRHMDTDFASATQLEVFIQGSNTSQTQSYVFTDRDLFEEGTYYYWLESVDMDGTVQTFGPVQVDFSPNQQQDNNILPVLGIERIYPNPFNPTTTIRFGIDQEMPVRLDIYNLRGQLVRTWDQGNLRSGYHQLVWDGKDGSNRDLGSGVYLLRLSAGSKSFSQKVMLIK